MIRPLEEIPKNGSRTGILLDSFREKSSRLAKMYAKKASREGTDLFPVFLSELESAERDVLSMGQQMGISDMLELVKGAQDVRLCGRVLYYNSFKGT